MRLAGLLICPVVLALLIVMGAARLSSALSEPLSEPVTQASGLVWDGRVFTTRAAFAKWLEQRGLSIREWERRHPASPWTTALPTRSASSTERQGVAPRFEQESNWFLFALGGAVALSIGFAGAAALRLPWPAMARRLRVARPTSTNGAGRGTAPRPPLAVTTLAVRTASAAAQRGVEVTWPRLEGAGFAARQGFGTVVAHSAQLGHELRYGIATGRFRVAFFYIFSALFSAVIGLATAILI
jgi:hypothetical protein